MRRKIVTPTAEADLREITSFIAAGNLDAADRYVTAALNVFEELPDLRTPVRASEHLPENVHSMQVPGFAGYTLRIAVFETETYLIAAFRPGLTAVMRDRRSKLGLGEI